MLTSLFSLFYVTREFHRFLHRGRAEILLLAELCRDFPEAEGKGYDNKTLIKKAKAWEEILILMVSNATSVSFKDAGGG